MKRVFRTSLTVRLWAVMVLSLFAASCSNDAFFGFDESGENPNYTILDIIANSKEFIDYQLSVQSHLMEVSSIDTTELEPYDVVNGKTVYISRQTISIFPIIMSKKILLESFPEYAELTASDKKYLLKKAIANDATLKDLLDVNFGKTILRTKSVNNEINSVKWIRTNSQNLMLSDSYGCSDMVTEANSMWSVGSCIWYAYENYAMAISDAISLARRYAKEFGGYGWESDNSGIMIDDPSATEDHMVFSRMISSPSPSFDFHVHPNGNLYPSGDDYRMWDNCIWIKHWIYDLNGNGICVVH